jgi:U3 small nucleolar RNA-associated protein MPP10
VPIITPEVTETLEDIIKKGILEGSWDDPVLVHISQNALSSKTLPDLSTLKSKESLSTLYESQFTSNIMGIAQNDPLASKKKEIEALWRSLSHSLDTLSHFHYRPKPDVSLLTAERPNVPTVALEEALPLTMNQSAVLAPQELHQALKKPLKDVTELSREERHSKHLQKKRDLKKKRKIDEAHKERLLVNADGTLSKRKETKLVKEKMLKSLSNQQNVTIIGGGNSKKPANKRKKL